MRQTTNETQALQSLMAEFIRLVAYQNEKPVFDDEGMVALSADNASPVYFSTRQVIAIARLLKGMTKPQGWRDADVQIIYELAAKAEQRESDDPDHLLHTMMQIHGSHQDYAPTMLNSQWSEEKQTMTVSLEEMFAGQPVLPWLSNVRYAADETEKAVCYAITAAVLRYTDDDTVLTFIAHPSDAKQVERQMDGELFPRKEWEGECELPSEALTPSSKKEIADYMLEALQQDPEEAWPLRQSEPGATWFAPRHGVVEIDGIPVPTAINEFSSANILSVEVGTNGFQGGDTGHGGRTCLRIIDEGCTDLRCRVKANGKWHNYDNVCGVNEIEIILGGDTELGTFSNALRFAADVLEKKITGELMLVVPKNYKQQ